MASFLPLPLISHDTLGMSSNSNSKHLNAVSSFLILKMRMFYYYLPYIVFVKVKQVNICKTLKQS